MPYKRILTIQDISCVGQCSMTVALPILSACGHEVCVLPTAVLSTHTGGFGKPSIVHLTAAIREIVAHWKENSLDFDLIYTGYLGSVEAIEQAAQIMQTMLAPGGVTIVDPAMADHGKLYSGLDERYAAAMKVLCERAHVMLPNVTEAAMISGLPYQETLDETYIMELMDQLGGSNVVLTGVGFAPNETGAAIRTKDGVAFATHEKLGKSYHGTGDMFASAFAGAVASGRSLVDSARIAGKFTCKCIYNTQDQPAHWYGVKFETALADLINMITNE